MPTLMPKLVAASPPDGPGLCAAFRMHFCMRICSGYRDVKVVREPGPDPDRLKTHRIAESPVAGQLIYARS